MKVLVLKPFPYAADHLHNVMLEAGTVHDVADDCVPGLKAEGYVKDPEPEPRKPEDVGAIEIPEGWADLAWNDMKTLAQSIAPDLGKNPSKAAAAAAIEAELARRAEAAKGAPAS